VSNSYDSCVIAIAFQDFEVLEAWTISNHLASRAVHRLQSVHCEPNSAGPAAEREDQRSEYEAVPEAEEDCRERGGQVQSQSGRAGLRHLRKSGGQFDQVGNKIWKKLISSLVDRHFAQK